MFRLLSLSAKIKAVSLVFLLAGLASVSITLWVTWQLEGGAAAVNEAGRLRMQVFRMQLSFQNHEQHLLDQGNARFSASLQLLREGDPSRPLQILWTPSLRAQFARIEEGWQHLSRMQTAATLPEFRAQGDALVQVIDDLVTLLEREMVRWTAGLHLFLLMMVALVIGATIVFWMMSYWEVLYPLERLEGGMAHIRQGQLQTRLQLESSGEFGRVASGFNLMAASLQSARENLEFKVREKTASLQAQHAQLQALYTVSAQMAEADNLQTLAQGFVHQVRASVQADAVAVRWSDEANERYVLLASEGLPPSLSIQEHCLPTGACICAPPKEGAKARVIRLHTEEAVTLPHCREAGYVTLVGVPLRHQQRLLGEVNLYFVQEQTLTPETHALLTAMAEHLASAMESLRVTALEREAAVAQERSLIARELHDSIAQSLAFLKIQTQLLRDAIAKGNTAARDRSVSELEVGVRECYADVRELLVHFRTRTSDEDIGHALRSTLSKFEHQTGLKGALIMGSAEGLPLPPDVQVQVLHIVQEALSNIRKHAQATQVTMSVQRHPVWTFSITDNGCGFASQEVAPDSLHVGLGIMKERAALIHADLQVISTPGTGTTVRLQLPSLAALPALGDPFDF